MTLRPWMCVIAWFVPLAVLAAEPTTPRIAGVRIGFSGRDSEGHDKTFYKVGYWTPIEVMLAGEAPPKDASLELTMPDGDGVLNQVSAPATSTRRITTQQRIVLYAKLGRPGGPLTVTLRSGQRVVAERTFVAPDIPVAMYATQELIVSVGPAPDLAAALTLRRQEELSRTVAVQLSGVEQLPDRALGYQGIDSLILTTSQPEVFRYMTSAQLDALEEWIRLGGKLVWCASQQARTVLADSFPLHRFAPGTLEEMIPIRTASMESFVGTSDPLTVAPAGRSERSRLDAPRLSHVRGRIEAYEGNRPTDVPLVVREQRGLGEIVFAAIDLNLPPISQWAARGRLLNRLLGAGEGGAADEMDLSARQGLHAGYDDLSGQLRGALDQFAGAPMIPFWIIGTLIALYLVAIGPFDYFLVKRVLGRMELTWITFPAWILLFGGLALWMAGRYKGHDIRVNQVDLVDVDQSTYLVRGTSWLNIFSPQDTSYDVAVDPSELISRSSGQADILMSWFGLPGAGLGGMNTETAAPPLEASPYRFAPHLDGLLGLPIRVWSTKPLVASWQGNAGADSRWQIAAQLSRDEEGTLLGTIANRLHRTAASPKPDVTLDDCTLYYGHLAYPLGSLEPGRELSVLEPVARTIEAVVTRRHPQGDRDVATPYDPFEMDAARVLEIMTVYDASGGRKYTHLLNRYQHFVDLSDELRAGRAILVGRLAEPLVTLSRDGRPLAGPQDTRWTMFRFVIPVADKTP